jgi:hypothetical protein
MTTRREGVRRAAAALAALLGFVLFGCDLDTASTSDSVSVEPSSATLAKGQSQEFVASGGYDYKWSLDDESAGTLSTRKGDRTVFTALSAPTGTVVTLTVTSTIEGTAEEPATTNALPSYSRTGEAVIHFK